MAESISEEMDVSRAECNSDRRIYDIFFQMCFDTV